MGGGFGEGRGVLFLLISRERVYDFYFSFFTRLGRGHLGGHGVHGFRGGFLWVVGSMDDDI